MSNSVIVAIDSVLSCLDTFPRSLLSECRELIDRIRRNGEALQYAEQRRDAIELSAALANSPPEKDLLEHVSYEFDFYS